MKLIHISTFLQISGHIASATIIDVSNTKISGSPTTSLPTSLANDNSDPCAFTDRVSLLNYIDSNPKDYNVSLLVKSCPSICLLVYGSGNPDISGIGAMISYVIQTAIFLTSAVAAFLFEFSSTDNMTTRLDAINLFSKLSVIVNKGNVFSSLSTLIASVIRIKQAPPLAELTFIKMLGCYQCFVCMGTILQLHPTSLNRRYITLISYTFVAYIFGTATKFMDGLPSYQTKTLEKVTISCSEEEKFSAYTANPGTVEIILVFFELIFCPLFLSLVFVFPLLDAYNWQILLPIKKRISHTVLGLFHTTLERFTAIALIIFLNVNIAYGLITSILELQQQRSRILKFSGSTDQDSVWGFGQVTIMLLWGPLIHDIIVELLEFFSPEDPEAAQLLLNIIKKLDHPHPKPLQSDAPADSDEADIHKLYNYAKAQSSKNGPNNPELRALFTYFLQDFVSPFLDATDFWVNFGTLMIGSPFMIPLSFSLLANFSNSKENSTLENTESSGRPGPETTPTPRLRQRPAWPLNEAGTYLPTRVSHSHLP